MEAPRRVLFIFLDGVGLGSADPGINPFAAAHLPTLSGILGGAPPLLEAFDSGSIRSGSAASRPIDATFDVAGLPQSGTGQTALLTGRDAPTLMGRHFGPWVPTSLRELLAAENFFQKLLDAGRLVGLANAFPRSHPSRTEASQRRPGAIPFAAASAGILTRDESSLRAGEALVSSITTDGWRRVVDPAAPIVEPHAAGKLLVRLSLENDLTFFAHFETDYIGHRGAFRDAIEVLERIDEFLDGVRETLPPDCLLIVTSDHGNIEDATAGHTRNPVPLIAIGPGSADVVDRVERLDQIAPLIMSMFEGGGGW